MTDNNKERKGNMKFLNGEWLVRDGFDVKYAANIYSADVEEKRLTLYAPFQVIRNPGMTLDGGLLTIEVTSPRPDIITTRIISYRQDHSHDPRFALNRTDPPVKIEESEKGWTFTSGRLALKIVKGDAIDFEYEYEGRPLTKSAWRGKALVTDDDGRPHVVESLDLGVGEKIYGLGERFTNFVKNGQTVTIWNQDGGTGTAQAYKNVPFYMSNRGYGVFVDSTDKVEFEIGSDEVSKVQFSVPGQELTYSVIGGRDLKGVLNTYTDLTGKPPLVPDWSFGLWLSTSFTTDYDEKTVNEFVDGMAERDIPLSVFHFDCRWMNDLELVQLRVEAFRLPGP